MWLPIQIAPMRRHVCGGPSTSGCRRRAILARQRMTIAGTGIRITDSLRRNDERSMPQLADLETIAALPGEPRTVSAAGVTRSAQRIATIENPSPFAQSSQRRLVIVADNERAARATLGAIRWFKTGAPRVLRDGWAISAVFLAYG